MERRKMRKIVVVFIICLFMNLMTSIDILAEMVSENDTVVISDKKLLDVEKSNNDEVIGSGECGELTWTIDAKGVLTITGNGDYYYQEGADWWYYAGEVKEAIVSVTDITSMHRMFYKCKNLEKITFVGSDVSKVTDMSWMFYDCNELSVIEWGEFNTSKVTNMSYMFFGCEKLTSLNLSNFNTACVTDMSWMFVECLGLKTLDLSSFDTRNVIDMGVMFRDCKNLKSININKFNTSKVTNMGGMFEGCANLISIDVSSFDTKNVTDMGGMFDGCKCLQKIDVSNFQTDKVTNMMSMFKSCESLEKIDLGSFNTANVYSMRQMFYNCAKLKEIDVSKFDTGKVVDMTYMFYRCSVLQELDISNFDISGADFLDYMFLECRNLVCIFAPENKSGAPMQLDSSVTAWVYEPTGEEVYVVKKAGKYVRRDIYVKENNNKNKCEKVGTILYSADLTTTSGTIPANSTFTVTSDDSENPTVSFDGVKNKNASAVSIPTTVNYKGITYKVTSVSVTSFTNTKDKAKYKVTGNKIGKLTVEYKAPTSKNRTSAKIPEYTVYKGIKFKVTSIASNALKNNKKLTTVTVGKNIQKIGKNAFYGCKKLKTIKVNSKVLKSVGKNALKGINKNCKVKVPKSKLKAYKKLFKNKGQTKTVKIIK